MLAAVGLAAGRIRRRPPTRRSPTDGRGVAERRRRDYASRMLTLAEARRLALSFAEVTEEDHHGIPSFRVLGKIFATVPDDAHVRVMLDPDAARLVVRGGSRRVRGAVVGEDAERGVRAARARRPRAVRGAARGRLAPQGAEAPAARALRGRCAGVGGKAPDPAIVDRPRGSPARPPALAGRRDAGRRAGRASRPTAPGRPPPRRPSSSARPGRTRAAAR